MRHNMNALGATISTFAFENGWQCNVEVKQCGHNEVLVAPSYLYTEEGQTHVNELIKWFKDNHHDRDKAKAEGLYFPHVKSNDALIRILDNVRRRPTEPHLAAQSDVIRAAANRGANHG